MVAECRVNCGRTWRIEVLFWMIWVILPAAAAVVAALLTGMLRRYAIRAGLIDRPNARSSHSIPTPRGGGLAIVVTSIAAIGLLCSLHVLSVRLFAALAGGGIAVAVVGFIDDRHTLPARVRLAVHLCAALWCLAWLGGLPPMLIGHRMVHLGWPGYVLGTLAIVWVLNLFNFMDGIDGIAASEAIFVTCAGAVLGSATATAEVLAAAIVCAASAGFLVWNWPPAKIFMGDVGSGYLGFAIAVLAVAATQNNPVSVWVWLILGGTFFVDATVTLARRTLHGERVHEAHRSHAYQWLARRWRSHLAVTLSVLAINVSWLLPAAWLASSYPPFAVWIVAGAYLPLIILAVAAGAGRHEQPAH
jgi:Fuc2NAc and GlcNAc transferase